MCLNHPETVTPHTHTHTHTHTTHTHTHTHPTTMEKLSSMKPVPGAKKVGDCCSKMCHLSGCLINTPDPTCAQLSVSMNRPPPSTIRIPGPNKASTYPLYHQTQRALPFLSLPCPSLKLAAAAATAKSLQSCPTLCDPIDDSPPGSPVPGILQARTLEWVAISFSNA